MIVYIYDGSWTSVRNYKNDKPISTLFGSTSVESALVHVGDKIYSVVTPEPNAHVVAVIQEEPVSFGAIREKEREIVLDTWRKKNGSRSGQATPSSESKSPISTKASSFQKQPTTA